MYRFLASGEWTSEGWLRAEVIGKPAGGRRPDSNARRRRTMHWFVVDSPLKSRYIEMLTTDSRWWHGWKADRTRTAEDANLAVSSQQSAINTDDADRKAGAEGIESRRHRAIVEIGKTWEPHYSWTRMRRENGEIGTSDMEQTKPPA